MSERQGALAFVAMKRSEMHSVKRKRDADVSLEIATPPRHVGQNLELLSHHLRLAVVDNVSEFTVM